MKIIKDCVSACCNAKIRVGGRDGFTRYHECTECHQPCSFVENGTGKENKEAKEWLLKQGTE